MAKKSNKARADGRISVQVYLGRDENNRRQYKTVYGTTQKDADEKALSVKLAMRKGIDVTAERDTFAEWKGRWAKIKKAEVSTTRYSALTYTAKHLTKTLGEMPISKIRTADIQGVISELAVHNTRTGKPTAPATLRLVKTIASQIFRVAVENRVIDYNPADAVRLPALTPVWERRALTQTEQSWIESTAHRAQCAAMVMMHAGLRRGELIPLLWGDVDLKGRTISVGRSVENIAGTYTAKGTLKTAASRRVVDIPQRLADYLAAQPRTSTLVCPMDNGQMHTQSSWVVMWESYLRALNKAHGDFSIVCAFPKLIKQTRKKKGAKGGRKAKPREPLAIPRITPHWLRHTFATNLYLAGVDVLTAKNQLGHANISTTLGIYTHLDAQYKRRSMDKLDVYLSECKSNASQTASEKSITTGD